MTKPEFIRIILEAADYYNRPFGKGAQGLYYQKVKDLTANEFKLLLSKHLDDRDWGHVFPLFSHLSALAGKSSDISVRAGIAFDDNPGIDGTISFDLRSETTQRTSQRRKIFIDRQVSEWKDKSPIEQLRISGCLQLPSSETRLLK